MKKVSFLLLILSAILCFSSCEQEDLPRKYSIQNNTSFDINELYVCEYNDRGERVYNHTVEYVSRGRIYNFTALNEDVVKVKIYVEDFDKWIQQVFYLDDEGVTKITINGNTLVGYKEP